MGVAWRSMVRAATDEALLAVELYDAPRQPRRLEGFYRHMHAAWHGVLLAKLRRDGVDPRYRDADGRLERVDGEPRLWDLVRCIEEEWPSDHPVRKNLELSIAVRHKIELLATNLDAVMARTAGYAQAMLVNFESTLVGAFGPAVSIGDRLRFPVYVGAITAGSVPEDGRPPKRVPAGVRKVLDDFESGLPERITGDQRYELRIHLIPQEGPRTDDDMAVSFIREEDLSAEQREALATLGRTGAVIVRHELRSVASHGLVKPGAAAAAIEARIPFKFGPSSEFPRAWRALGVRPPSGDPHPEQTDERYCTYDEPHRDYLYTQAFIDKVVRNCDTAAKYRRFIGREPRPKVSTIGPSSTGAASATSA
jgi:hypothetical protein